MVTHQVTFGYTTRMGGVYHELLGGALNFSLPGYDTNSVARTCCEFVHDRLVSYRHRDRPPLELTQTKLWVREYWLNHLFIRYNWFADGEPKL